MKKFIFLFIVFFPFFINAEIVDWTLATIDNECVTYQEFKSTYREIKKNAQAYKSMGIDLSSKEAVLNQLINNNILTLEAEKNDINVSDADVEAQIEQFKKMNQLNDELFKQVLKQQGMTLKELKKTYRERIRNQKLQEIEIRNSVTPPTEEEMKSFYNKNKKDMKSNPKVHILQILVKDNPNADLTKRLAIKKRIEKAYTKAKAGANFAKLAKMYSDDDNTKNNGGDAGWIEKGKTAPEFDKVIFSLRKNEVSQPFQTRWGFFIVKVIGKKRARPMKYEDAKPVIRNMLLQKKSQEAFQNWINERRKEYGIKVYLSDKDVYLLTGNQWKKISDNKILSQKEFQKKFNKKIQ